MNIVAVRIFLVRRAQLPGVIRAAETDGEAYSALRMIGHWLTEWRNRSLCLHCKTPFNTGIAPEALVVVVPLAESDSDTAAGICPRCCDCDDEHLETLAIGHLRER